MNTIQTYHYIVAEDERLIRKNLIKKINSLHLPLTLIGEASNGKEAIQLVEKHCPNLMITDIRMPECDGIELTHYLQKNYPNIKTLILSGYDDFSYAQFAIRYGVKDYLLKPVTVERLSESLQKLLILIKSEDKALESFYSNTDRLDQDSICHLLEKYLQENFQHEVFFQEVGEKFGFTPEYLGKLFKKHTGETPSKYLTRLRMNEAKRLLLQNPDMEIQKVGELTGYRDSAYFSRVFKTYVGMQPSEYRNHI